MTKPGHERPVRDNSPEGKLFSGEGSLTPPPLEDHSGTKPEAQIVDGTVIEAEPLDDFDRRDGQSIWTVEYTREGEYPEQPNSSNTRSIDKSSGGGSKKRVYGSEQLIIADNDRTAQTIHEKSAAESSLRQEGITEEEQKGADIARRWLEDHK